MNMKMPQDISAEEMEFYKEAHDILAAIKAKLPYTLKDTPVTISHSAGPVMKVGDLYLDIESDLPYYDQIVDRWWQVVLKLAELGAFKIVERDPVGCAVEVLEPRFSELLSEYDRPMLLQRCSLELDLRKATLQYKQGRLLGIDPSSQPIKLLALLLRKGEASYADLRRELHQESRVQRDMQFIKRDLRKILLSAGMSGTAIKNLVAPKKNWGYVMGCEEEKP